MVKTILIVTFDDKLYDLTCGDLSTEKQYSINDQDVYSAEALLIDIENSEKNVLIMSKEYMVVE